ncbi:MAG: ATP-dependent helicase HrpB [Magnetococcales bacterium]|nr:ATP-dependent helicase HrpB [Magnetococcales bacterium]
MGLDKSDKPFPDFPIVPILDQIGATLTDHSTAILTAPPGSGKTTLVPLALIQQSWLENQKILMLEPRRLATRAAAVRMSELIDDEVGGQVGYQVRFDRKISANTRIEVVTEGILTRRLQKDPELSGIGLVIFDEFHERSLHADLGLALCLDLLALREDLRILVMSATLQTDTLAQLMHQAPVLTAEGKCYPVAVHYLDHQPRQRIAETTVSALNGILQTEQGDILTFLPGAGEIRATEALLRQTYGSDIDLFPLYGNLSKADQDRAIRPKTTSIRRIILATDIAETSLTIPDISIIVDAGFCRRPKFHPATGLTRLETMRISKASAEQRAGRVGRTAPGSCYRLWTKQMQSGLQATTPPEISEADLTSLILELAVWGVQDVSMLSWLDQPPTAAVQTAREMLQHLHALDGHGRVTDQGKKMAELPVHPRLAHMILWAKSSGEKKLACDLAALLTERSPITARGHSADIGDRLGLLTLFRTKGARSVRASGGDPTLCARINRSANQFQRLARINKNVMPQGIPGQLLAAAFPDRIALQRPGQHNRYLLANGRGARLHESDPLLANPLLTVAELDAGQAEGQIYLAASLHESDLRSAFSDQIHKIEDVRWDSRHSRVITRLVEKFAALELSEKPLHRPDPELVRAALIEGIQSMGINGLNWSDKARTFQARVILMRNALPEQHWPDLSDDTLLNTLSHWLGPYLDSVTRREQIEKIDLFPLLKDQLSWSEQQQLDKEAPTHLKIPSGSRPKLTYTTDQPPFLAVRMQELFGLAETPRICGGRIPLTLHLLNPARRPVQVTTDLRSFWQRTWPEICKELRGRYPKHHWPDDPWTATATARTKNYKRR